MTNSTYITYDYLIGKNGKSYPFVGYLMNEFVGILFSLPIAVPKNSCDVPNNVQTVLDSAEDFRTVSKKLNGQLKKIISQT